MLKMTPCSVDPYLCFIFFPFIISVQKSLIGFGKADVPHNAVRNWPGACRYASRSAGGSLLSFSCQCLIIRIYIVGTPEKCVMPPFFHRFQVQSGLKLPDLNSIHAPV